MSLFSNIALIVYLRLKSLNVPLLSFASLMLLISFNLYSSLNICSFLVTIQSWVFIVKVNHKQTTRCIKSIQILIKETAKYENNILCTTTQPHAKMWPSIFSEINFDVYDLQLNCSVRRLTKQIGYNTRQIYHYIDCT